MKRLLFYLFAISLSLPVRAQITYENTYIIPNNNTTLYIVQLDSSEFNYLLIDPPASTFILYNLNHSINFSGVFPISINYSDVLPIYFSRKLFDCDTANIEYLISSGQPGSFGSPRFVRIYRVDGTILFNAPGAMISSYGYPIDNKKPVAIFNSNEGTKMLLTYYYDSIQVYNLCGQFPVSITADNILSDPANYLKNLYPSPTKNAIYIDYELPANAKSGEIIFYDLQGNFIKKFVVDRQFKNLVLTTDDLPSGEYICQLKLLSGENMTKRFIKIN